MNDKLKLAVECKDMFYSILTNPDGLVVIEGSAEDRYILEQALSKLNDLVDLAESYLSIQGFPEERDCHECSLPYAECGCYDYNQALKECKLSLLKKMDGISNVIISSAYPFLPTETETKVIKALKDHLTK